MRYEVCFLDLQLIENASNIERLVRFRVARIGVRREAHASEIERDHGVVFDQRGAERRPHIAGVAKAVQHDDRWTLSSDSDVKGCSVCRYLLRVKTGQEIGSGQSRRERVDEACAEDEPKRQK